MNSEKIHQLKKQIMSIYDNLDAEITAEDFKDAQIKEEFNAIMNALNAARRGMATLEDMGAN